MDELAELKQVAIKQHEALRTAILTLGAIGQSNSKYADEAWAAFTQAISAADALKQHVERHFDEGEVTPDD